MRPALAGGLRLHALPRGPFRRGAPRQPGRVPLRPCERDGGHQRLRHGHRQVQRGLRHPLQHALRPGGILPGGGPRRPRRVPGRLHPHLQQERRADLPVPHRPQPRRRRGQRLRPPDGGPAARARLRAPQEDDALLHHHRLPALLPAELLRPDRAGAALRALLQLLVRGGGAGRHRGGPEGDELRAARGRAGPHGGQVHGGGHPARVARAAHPRRGLRRPLHLRHHVRRVHAARALRARLPRGGGPPGLHARPVPHRLRHRAGPSLAFA